ncbi:hypothetical protein [Dyella telluris]|uniref:Uncharacterized protein n=1 Tax=Dyella telluris TaxID=2763498 RepID=A0A7G8Q3Z8_9GAMM|nr:hypothetical protein [Dyella telluris]QNK01506.1 hypothetical protein H8F01_21135 [Dyella telluris]
MLTVAETDLDLFFGSESERMDADVPWPYSGLIYRVKSGDWSVEFVVSPSYRSVKLVLGTRGRVVYELDAQRIADLKIHEGPSHPTLEIEVGRDQGIFLRLQPELFLGQKVDSA